MIMFTPKYIVAELMCLSFVPFKFTQEAIITLVLSALIYFIDTNL